VLDLYREEHIYIGNMLKDSSIMKSNLTFTTDKGTVK